MQRMTRPLAGGGYEAEVPLGVLLVRLGRLEDLYDALCTQREQAAQRMQQLKVQGKTKSATYAQMMAVKLTAQKMINQMDLYIPQEEKARALVFCAFAAG